MRLKKPVAWTCQYAASTITHAEVARSKSELIKEKQGATLVIAALP